MIEGDAGIGKNYIIKAITECKYIVAGVGFTDELAISQLFGHEKGAFTGATSKHEGYLEQAMAKGFSLVLDEINSYSPTLQFRLLRLLEERKFQPLGSQNEIKFTQKCFCISNQSIELLVSEKKFRKDLADRLGPPIRIPSLKERPEDIQVFLDTFIQKYFHLVYKEQNRRSFSGTSLFENDAYNLLLEYNWPGNIREMNTVIRRLAMEIENDASVTVEIIKSVFPTLNWNNRSLSKETESPPEWLNVLEDGLKKRLSINKIQDMLHTCWGREKTKYNNLKKSLFTKRELIIKYKSICPESNDYLFKNQNK